MKKTTLKITGMTCDRCADRIRSLLEKEPGVIKAEVSLEQGTALVRFKPSETTLDDILNSGAFTTTFMTKGSDGLTITHRYSAMPLNARGRA
ncbi:MAG: heavy-metal-associated domain-containing protein [Nitrososphaerota archaeon]|nr:heavy-metal-associated domain-containing protein [Nitrososphaerota archaeon]